MTKLAECKDCGNQISKKAAACPQCGAPQKKKGNIGCGGAIVIVLGIAAVAGLLQDPSETSGSKSSGSSTASQQAVQKQAVQKSPAEVRRDQIEGQFSVWDGSHRGLERYIKKNLKDPDSYDHIETTFGDKGDYVLVQTKYRAKNGFGGYTIEVIQGKFGIDGRMRGQPVLVK